MLPLVLVPFFMISLWLATDAKKPMGLNNRQADRSEDRIRRAIENTRPPASR